MGTVYQGTEIKGYLKNLYPILTSFQGVAVMIVSTPKTSSNHQQNKVKDT